MDAPNWMALQAIHATVHNVDFGSKYTWFGFGYISNMYFKKIANKPMYYFEKGGDLSFTDCINSPDQGGAVEIHEVSYGDIDGNPVARTGWYLRLRLYTPYFSYDIVKCSDGSSPGKHEP